MAEPSAEGLPTEVELPITWLVRAELRADLHGWGSTSPCPIHNYACVLSLARFSPLDGLPSRALPGVALVGLGLTSHAAILLRSLEIPSFIVTHDDWTALGAGPWHLIADPNGSTVRCFQL